MFCLPSRRYATALGSWLALYAVLLFASISALKSPSFAWQPLHVFAALVPMLPLFGVLVTVMRRYRELDELQKKIIAEGIMFGFGLTAILTESYGFLQENAGAPQLSYEWVWPTLAVGWLAGQVMARFRYR